MTKPRKLQEIFNAVIEAEHYPNKEYITMENWKPTSNFMCESLIYALDKGAITKEECDKAKRAIRGYINTLATGGNYYHADKELPSLWSALFYAKIVEFRQYSSEISQPILLNIYKNWAKRPFPKKKKKKK